MKSFTISNKSIDEATVLRKLERLRDLPNKRAGWITADLEVKPSSWISRAFWTLIAKHFDRLRELFYGVNLQKSQNFLFQLESQISERSYEIYDLFAQAVAKYDQIAPRRNFLVCHEDIQVTLSQKARGEL